MKQFSVLLFVALLFVLPANAQVSIPAPQKNAKKSFRLLNEVQLQTKQFISREAPYTVTPIKSSNSNCDAAVIISKKDLKLELLILNKDEKQILRQPVKSEAVSIAPDAERFAVAGKISNQYHHDIDVPFANSGIEVFDFTGKLLYEINETGRIYSFQFLNQGRLFMHSANGYMLIDNEQKVIWKHTWNPIHTEFSEDMNFMYTYFLNNDGLTFTASLCDLNTGNILKSWPYKSDSEIMLVYADKQNEQYAYTEYSERGETYRWAINVVDLKSGQLKHRIENLPDGPISLCYNSDENAFGMLLLTPAVKGVQNPGCLQIGEWRPADNSLIKENLKTTEVDFNNDRFLYNPTNHYYVLHNGNALRNYKVQ